VYAEDSNSGNHLYPSEEEFISMVANLVQSELNVSTTEEQLGKMVHLAPVAPDPDVRLKEMRDLWRLLQDHEYLATRMFAEQEILPGLIGSCGDVFAVSLIAPKNYKNLQNL
jgi:Protein-kinase domain of FAM69